LGFGISGRLWYAVVSAGFLALAGCGSRAGFRPEYRMQVTVGGTTHWGMGADWFAKLAAERTGGLVKVKPYFGGQLLRGAQLNSAQMVANGAIDCAFESTINIAPVVAEMNVFSLPFFVGTFTAVDRIEAGGAGKKLFEAMRAVGLEPLAWGENGFRQLTNSKRPVRGLADLKGLRVRVVGTPIFVDIFRALGADPINMNWGDAVTAFQQGTVDGQENPMGILLSVQINQYHPYVTLWNYVVDPLVFFWNKRQWDAFPDSVKAALRGAAEEAGAYQKALARVGLDGGESERVLRERFATTPAVAEPLVHLQSAGMTVDSLDGPAQVALLRACQSVYQDWLPRIGMDLVAAAEADKSGPAASHE